MSDSNQLKKDTLDIEINGVEMRIAAMHRDGTRAPILFMHGFGSTKEDYADIVCFPAFDGHELIGFDAPGCGATECDDVSLLSIPFLHQTALQVLDHYKTKDFHLVGHSMGGLAALFLASDPRVLSFTNIEGNVAPEDCFLSRQIIDNPSNEPAEFLKSFADRAWHTSSYSHRLFAAMLRFKVRADAIGPIFRSMVEISDNRDLLTRFTNLPCAKMFVYGDQNRSLSYLPRLQQQGVQLVEIPHSGHWPMYANPAALWQRIAAFIHQVELANG